VRKYSYYMRWLKSSPAKQQTSQFVWIITALPMLERLTAHPEGMTGAGDVAAAFIEVLAKQPDPRASRLKSTQRQSARTRRFFLGNLHFDILYASVTGSF
jgi:hypothetical protein